MNVLGLNCRNKGQMKNPQLDVCYCLFLWWWRDDNNGAFDDEDDDDDDGSIHMIIPNHLSLIQQQNEWAA